MDHHQQHPHPHQQHSFELQQDPALAGATYAFYHNQDAVDAAYGMPFSQQMAVRPTYEVIQSVQMPRQLSASDLQAQQLPVQQYPHLSLMANQQYAHPQTAVYSASPTDINHNALTSASPPPQSPTPYDPLSPPVSGSDTSADHIYISRNSSGTGSPSSSRANSLVHRNPLRYNPTPSPSGSSGRRGRGRSVDSDEDDTQVMISVVQDISHNRKEATRRQRIEAEQRRRDELRDGYARLKDVLPTSNQKSSKVSLLDRATNHIIQLEKSNRQMMTRLMALENEVARLRALSEKISLGVNVPTDGSGVQQVNMMDRPLSPPPEVPQQMQGQTIIPSQVHQPTHSLTLVTGEPPREDSDGSGGSEAGM